MCIRDSFNTSDNSQSYWIFRVSHIGKHILNAWIRLICIMNQYVILSETVFTKFYCFKSSATFKDNTFVIILSEDHRLTMFQDERPVVTDFFVGNGIVDTVIENDTVLKYFNHRCSLMFSSLDIYLGRQCYISINSSGKEFTLGSDYQFPNRKWFFDSSKRRCFCHQAFCGRWRI